MRRSLVVAAVLAAAVTAPHSAGAAPPEFTPGAASVGDPYFPNAGNGGYDVLHYDIDAAYDPATDALDATTHIRARATQDLSSLNLDLQGLNVRSVRVARRLATFSRDGQELTVTPAEGIREGRRFTVVVRYDGVPESTSSAALGPAGFFHTDDGAIAVGQPDSARFWYPANEHPVDAASYRIRVTVPAGLEAISNGRLKQHGTVGDRSTWTWQAPPMTSYESFVAIGEFDVDQYARDGIQFLDAIDTKLLEPSRPRTGEGVAYSQMGDSGYRRLTRTIDVPAGGGELTFWVNRSTESDWDFFFVEAHTPGADDWTTLPDANGHTSSATGSSCSFWFLIHPFISHYQADDGSCAPTGSTGEWNAATGDSFGYEQWRIDLSDYAGGQVEVSLSYAGDDVVQYNGVLVDDVTTPTGDGSTSFEDDGDPLDGWTVPGAPEGSPGNGDADWIAATAADLPEPVGTNAKAAFAAQPDILAFLSTIFGKYPFRDAGGVVDAVNIGFALETETRSVYSPGFFYGPADGDYTGVVAHENTHQWTGDLVRLARWQDIWLNEGFATYGELLWSEHAGLGTVQEFYDFFTTQIPADDPYWQLTIGDPGPVDLFAGQVYSRGALTLHALRMRIGDKAFFRLMHRWIDEHRYDAVTTADFIALAERVSHQQLDAFFDEWLYTPGRPASLPQLKAASRSAAAAVQRSAGPFGLSHLKR